MSALATAVFGLVVVAYVWASRRLEQWLLTAPIVFTLAGTAVGIVATDATDPATVHGLAELTLALILFHDAAQVRPRQLRSDAALCARLLLVGLPLTIASGYLVGRLLFPELGTWLALLLAAALAPTDAGLGAATVLNPVVPVRVRRLLNVESGLNDGLATPVVLFALAAAGGTQEGVAGTIGSALAEIAVGVVVGILIGAACGRLLSHARRRLNVEPELVAVATLAVPLACYYGSVASDGNGFVAAFVSGTAFAAAFTRTELGSPGVPRGDEEAALQLTTWISTALGYAVWTLFGVVGVAHLASWISPSEAVFAALSLTVLRLLPVALALVGSGLRAASVLFVGWFGPRGLASVVFALIAVETLPETHDLETVIGTMTVTVLLSVVLHGMSANPGAERYGRWVARAAPVEELQSSVEPISGRGRRPDPDRQRGAHRRR